MLSYSIDTIPGADDAPWEEFRKTTSTRMFYVEGPVHVCTREGCLERSDSWIAVDAEGYPYPIDPIVHKLSYKLIQNCEHCTCYQPCCDCGETND